MSLEIYDGKNETRRVYNKDNHGNWVKKISKMYKLYLSDEIDDNIENKIECRSDVKKFWLEDMRMPPLLQCYERKVHVFNID